MTTHDTFTQETTATQVAESFKTQIRGRTVIITGSTVGTIGYATAHAVALGDPGLLIISGRSLEKLNDAASHLLSDHPSLNVRKLIMDLSSQKSVREAAKEVNEYSENVDILICNAGVMSVPKHELTEDGVELIFGSNHISHFLFTNLIMDKLKSAAQKSIDGATRIINVSSLGHMYSPIRFSDYNFTHNKPVPAEESPNWERLTWRGATETLGYQPMVAYGQSKTANILFSVSLNQRLQRQGIYSFALHPGAVRSAGGAPMLDVLPEHVTKFFQLFKTIDQGASTTMVAAFDPTLRPDAGVFLSDCQVAEPCPWAVDQNSSEKLWRLSEQLVGQEFDL